MLREAASEPRWDVLMVRLTDPIVDTLRNTLLTAVANGTGLIAMGNPLPPGSDRWAGGYRTALETSGIVSVLAGTGNKQHLMENVAALGRPGRR